MRDTSEAPSPPGSLEGWIAEESSRARDLLLRNVSPPGALPGAIVASPSRSSPDYYFHWVRDSGIAVRALLILYQRARAPGERRRYLGLLLDFVSFSRRIQRSAIERGCGLGEPKFTVDGLPYTGPWARPQDDGPAIRAVELTHLAFALLDEGEGELVRQRLYDGKLPTDSVIKVDLEYIARRWREPCFDLWEEVRGHHFFTQLLERRALLEGAELAARLGDTGAASFYREQGALLGQELSGHWDPGLRHVVATREAEYGPCGERSGLDSSVPLATLGGYCLRDEIRPEGLYPVDQEHVLATVAALERVFVAIYPINDPSLGIAGTAMGRYPEDHYDGVRTDALGGPWPSLTIGFAAYYHKLVERYRAARVLVVTAAGAPFFRQLAGPALRPGDVLAAGDPAFGEAVAAIGRRGDDFLLRLRHHLGAGGAMAEQMDPATGAPRGAVDLTMNYAAFLIAADARSYVLAAT